VRVFGEGWRENVQENFKKGKKMGGFEMGRKGGGGGGGRTNTMKPWNRVRYNLSPVLALSL